MAQWPGNPVASMSVRNYGGFLSGGTSSAITWNGSVVNNQTVTDVEIQFQVSCDFDDHTELR